MIAAAMTHVRSNNGPRCSAHGAFAAPGPTNVARHAQFDAGHPELRGELLLAGNSAECVTMDRQLNPSGSVLG
jgi:hypothetical protein